MNRDYSVFLSHAGPDKESIAIPLYERLRERNIHAFLDREELHVGDNGPRVMEYAMNTAPVGVFILSPEFAARNWTMAELICFQKREREALESNRPLPILIPVFYRLDIATCRNETTLFRAKNESGDSAFLVETFFERAAGNKITVAQVARAMKQVTLRTGIENHNCVSNAVSADMQSLRGAFIKRIVDEIEVAVIKTKASGAEDDAIRYWRAMEHAADNSIAGDSGTVMSSEVERDSFAPHFDVWQNPTYVYLPMQQSIDDSVGSHSSGVEARDIILQEGLDGPAPVIAIQGMPGIGKTCTLRALCHDQKVRNRFKDGVFVIRLGANAVLQTFIAGLSTAVAVSGGRNLASHIALSKSLESATAAAMKWFVNHTCLFLLDDVWSKPVDGTAYLEALSRICAGGKDSALVFSTREKRLISHKSVTHDVRLLAHEPRGKFSRSVLLRTATGNVCATVESSTDVPLNLLLDACCGLPVALAGTGRAIFQIAIDVSRDYDRAISLYYALQSKTRAAVIDHRAGDEYMSFTRALHVSISILDSTRSEGDAARSPYICAEMHRSLCVLEKQQWVPVTMLWRLWNTTSYEYADFVADKLSEAGLVDVHYRKIGDNEVKGIQLHDLVHDVATQNAMNANEESAWHVRLLQGYASRDGNNLPMQDGCREWWKTDRGVDKYVDENIVRHLIGAGDVREAALLVTRPQWIARLLERCTILSLEQDIDLATTALNTLSDAVIDRKDTGEGLRLIRNCVRAGLSAILDNPREVYFQIIARLFYAKDSSSFAKRMVQYAERHAVKPCLRNASACVQQAESVGGRSFPCNAAVRCMQVVESEGILIAGFYGGKIVVFDMETCKRKAEWEAHKDDVNCFAVTTDERLLVSGCDDKTAKVWDMTNDFAVVAVLWVGWWVYCIDVTPDNQRCVVGDGDRFVSVWELESGRCVVSDLGEQERCVTSVAVSPDGQLVASADDEGVIKLWAMNDESEMDSVHSAGMHDNLGTSFFFGASSRPFQASTGDRGSGSSNVSLVATLKGHTFGIETLRFTKDGSKLVSGSWDKTVRLWDVGTGLQIGGAFSDHTDWVRSVSFSNDEHEIFSVGDDGVMCVWSMDGNLKRRVQFAEERVGVNDAKIISGGEKVVWRGGDWIHVTDVRSDLSAHASGSRYKGVVSGICVSPNGTRVISGSPDGTLMVWDTATGLQVGSTIEGHGGWMSDVAVTPDGQRFVSVSLDGTVRVWDLERHEQLAVLEGHSDDMICVEISLDGKTAITVVRDGTVLTIALDGKTAITGFLDGTVLMWDLGTCNWDYNVLQGHSDTVRGLYLAQDGQHFVSLSRNEAILWSTGTAEMVKRIEKECVHSVSIDEIENLFGVTLICNLRMGDFRLGSDENKITYHQNGTKLVLATMDSGIVSMDFSWVTKTLCVRLESGRFGIFELELEDVLDLVLVEE